MHEMEGKLFHGRLREMREALHAVESLSPEDKKKLHEAAAQGEAPFLDMLKQLLANAGPVLDLVIKYLPAILALFAK